MKLFRHADDVARQVPGAVYAIGNFDGVHRGHQAVIGHAATLALAAKAPVGVLTFEPHPRSFFAPDTPPFRLTPFRAKMHRLQALGCDLAVVLHFDKALASITADAFSADLIARGLRAHSVVVGYDFVYGKGRAGTAASLAEAGERLGFAVSIVPPATTTDGIAFSSTHIRERLESGDPAGAARALGRFWEIEGRVEPGARIGRTIGFPTANIAFEDYQRPAAGIYAVQVGIEESSRSGAGGIDWRLGVGYVGTRPAVDGGEIKLEVNLFDFDGDLYGRHLRVRLIGWIRGDRNFDGLAALRRQIALDAAEARALLATTPLPI